MDWKKNEKHLPSLRLFLLVGIVLNGSCKEAQKMHVSSNELGFMESWPPEANRGINQGSVQAADEDKLKKLIPFNYKKLSHLRNRPLVMLQSCFEGDGAKSAVESLYKSFVFSQAYPKELEGSFAPLSEFTFRSRASGMPGGQYKNKFAYGIALNEIAQFWKVLHDIYKKMLRTIDNGVPVDEVENLQKELDICLRQIDPNKGINTPFRDSKKFYNLKKSKLLSRAKMACLMTELERAGALIGHSNLGPIWIKSKNSETRSDLGVVCDASRSYNGFFEPSILKERGSGISPDWLVRYSCCGSCPMPKILPLLNGTKLRDVQYSEHRAELGNDVVQHNPGAAKQEKLEFGQLLFTLFRGSFKADFIDLAYVKKVRNKGTRQYIQLNIKEEAFQELKDIISKDEYAFASYLGTHIKESGLDSLFVIPNVDDLQARLVDVLRDPVYEASMHANTRQEAPLEQQKIPMSVDKDLVVRLSQSILDVYSSSIDGKPSHISGLPSNTVKELTIKRLASLYSNPYNNLANVTFVQRLCIKLAHKLSQGGSLYDLSQSSEKKSGFRLLNAVAHVIESETDGAIVKKQGSQYVPTTVTKRIRKDIQEFITKLAEKDGAAHITYATIKDNTNGRFDIEKIRSAMKEDCDELARWLSALRKVQPDTAPSLVKK